MEEMELGSLLKSARQEKGLTLDDIQEETKIRKKYLEAIEENNFEVLPGKVYLKVFVKGYAREVGLDYQELLAEYKVLNIKEKKESNLQKDYLDGTKVSHNSKKKNKKNPFKIILIILLILFLGAAAVYTYQYISNSEIRLLSQEETQPENIEEESQILERDTENSSANSETKEEVKTDETETEVDIEDSSETDNNIELSASDEDQSLADDLLDSFNSDVLNEENTEIIDQNKFEELDGLNTEEQNQITEIIVSEDNSQQETQEDTVEADQTETITQNDNQNDNPNEQNSDLNNSDLNTEAENESIEASNNVQNNQEEAQEEENEDIVQNTTLKEELSITADDRVWITVDSDGDNVFTGTLEAGDQQEFEFEERLYMKIGNGNAINVELGGENYGPWAESGEISEVEFVKEENEINVNNLRE